MITYTEANEIQQQRFKIGTAPTVPTSLYVMLSTTAINQDGTGATEPSGGNYSRVEVPSSDTYWSSPSDGTISNLVQIQFPKASADWGTITYFALTAVSSGDDIRYYQDLNSSKIVQQDDVLVFEVGALTVTVSNA